MLEIANRTDVPSNRFGVRYKSKRRLGIFQQSGMFDSRANVCGVQRARTVDELEAAYRLVHDVFVEKKFMLPQRSGMRIRIFETSNELAMFVGKVQGEVVGTIGWVLDSNEMGLPSDRVFRRELSELRRLGKQVCEVTNLAILPPFRKGSMCTELMRVVLAQTWIIGCHYLVCSVSPEQKTFFDFMGFKQIGSERSYSDEVHDPVVCMCWDVESYQKFIRNVELDEDSVDGFLKNYFVNNNPYMKHIRQWNFEANRLFSNTQEICRLFKRCGDFFDQCTPQQLSVIRARLGRGFEDVYRVEKTDSQDLKTKFVPNSSLRLVRFHSRDKKSRYQSGVRGDHESMRKEFLRRWPFADWCVLVQPHISTEHRGDKKEIQTNRTAE